ncbi:MAG: IS66 family insertion sequence element accessory protein TnpB, partial [Gammaproteobacteria bacterium]|nr:IS66 family insertion sequence element accessory protein TnpB [Gammaproteobacteria bacterium]
MRNPQRSQQEWRQLFKQQQHSGLSAVEFCRQQHIIIKSLYARR